MMERVTFAEHNRERNRVIRFGFRAGSSSWEALAKTAPELRCRKRKSKCRRTPALRDRVCLNPTIEIKFKVEPCIFIYSECTLDKEAGSERHFIEGVFLIQ